MSDGIGSIRHKVRRVAGGVSIPALAALAQLDLGLAPPQDLDARTADHAAVLLGAVGNPKFDGRLPSARRTYA